MRRALMDMLACPIDHKHPLELYVFRLVDIHAMGDETISEGMIVCPQCLRWFPIREDIPELLPDELRKQDEDSAWLKTWKEKQPENTVWKRLVQT